MHDVPFDSPDAGMNTDWKNRRSRALSFLAGQQTEDGHFASEVSRSAQMSDPSVERSVYLHAYVLQALSDGCSADARAAGMLERARLNLTVARQGSGWWRFYGPDSPEPPDDADDTAVALSALLSAERPPASRWVQEANRWLESLEGLRSESGLYKTWSDATWNAECFELPDVVVNANILFLQCILGRPDFQVAAYLDHVSHKETYHLLDLYSASRCMVPFLISRCHRQGNILRREASRRRICEFLLRLRKRDGAWDSDLDTVLALLALLNLGHIGPEVTAAADGLRERQQGDGGWECGAFFRDLAPRYYGSRCLTTALCLEAFCTLEGRTTPNR